jgi:5-methyltetrahydropteroyltriglutamate--homocysteine methyltransferase
MSAFYPDPGAPGLAPEALPIVNDLHAQVEADYPTMQDYLDDVKGMLLNEAKNTIDAGVDSIQFDSPDLLAFTNPAMPPEVTKAATRWRVDLNNQVLAELPREMLEIHACWGNYVNTQIMTLGSITNFLPELYELEVGTIGPFEVFDGLRDFAELEALKAYPVPAGKKLALGIVSVKTRNVEPVEVLRKRYDAAAEIVGPERLVVSPGCGFASELTAVVSIESAKRKLANLVKAVHQSG